MSLLELVASLIWVGLPAAVKTMGLVRVRNIGCEILSYGSRFSPIGKMADDGADCIGFNETLRQCKVAVSKHSFSE